MAGAPVGKEPDIPDKLLLAQQRQQQATCTFEAGPLCQGLALTLA